MRKILSAIAVAAFASAAPLLVAGTGARAEEAHNAAEPTHFPIHKPKQKDWSFYGPFGTYDKAQLQRGLKVYKEVCSACHSMKLVAFRTLASEPRLFRSAGEGVRGGIYRARRPQRRRRDVRSPGHSVRLFPVAVPECAGGGCRQWRRGPAGLLADRQGARRRARLSDLRLRHLHAVCRERPGLHPFAADRLRRGAAGRHGDRRRHLLQSLFHRRQVARHAAAAVGRPGDLRRRHRRRRSTSIQGTSPPS